MKALYYGDNLQVLRDSIATESVDLIYLDPPFNSNATYNVVADVQATWSGGPLLAKTDKGMISMYAVILQVPFHQGHSFQKPNHQTPISLPSELSRSQ